MLFSATLLPIRYYKQLLGADEGDYEVYAKSVFDARRKGLFIANDVTSKYSRRTESEYYNIASYLHRIVQMRTGNYMVFFPSHAFLKKVLEVYEENFADEQVECLVQDEYMNEQSREEFLMRFGGGRSARKISSAFSSSVLLYPYKLYGSINKSHFSLSGKVLARNIKWNERIAILTIFIL